jgi:hypothetical protein
MIVFVEKQQVSGQGCLCSDLLILNSRESTSHCFFCLHKHERTFQAQFIPRIFEWYQSFLLFWNYLSTFSSSESLFSPSRFSSDKEFYRKSNTNDCFCIWIWCRHFSVDLWTANDGNDIETTAKVVFKIAFC